MDGKTGADIEWLDGCTVADRPIPRASFGAHNPSWRRPVSEGRSVAKASHLPPLVSHHGAGAWFPLFNALLDS